MVYSYFKVYFLAIVFSIVITSTYAIDSVEDTINPTSQTEQVLKDSTEKVDIDSLMNDYHLKQQKSLEKLRYKKNQIAKIGLTTTFIVLTIILTGHFIRKRLHKN